MRVFNGWMIFGATMALEMSIAMGVLPRDYLWKCWMEKTFDWKESALPNIPGW